MSEKREGSEPTKSEKASGKALTESSRGYVVSGGQTPPVDIVAEAGGVPSAVPPADAPAAGSSSADQE